MAVSLLDHCYSMDVVKTMLNYAPHHIHHYNNMNRNLHLAIHAEQKYFVGHHYYQNYLWDQESLQTCKDRPSRQKSGLFYQDAIFHFCKPFQRFQELTLTGTIS